MGINDIGPLRAADEGLHHQIVGAFATIAESDWSWTEKIWSSIARIDGSLQLDFGLGKYHNRASSTGSAACRAAASSGPCAAAASSNRRPNWTRSGRSAIEGPPLRRVGEDRAFAHGGGRDPAEGSRRTRT